MVFIQKGFNKDKVVRRNPNNPELENETGKEITQKEVLRCLC
jgi:hypothetical protein